MRIEGKEYRTIWFENNVVKIIDQTKLPHQFVIKELKTVKDAINAIKVMEVRGAPLIGGTAAYGIALAVQENNDLEFIKKISEDLKKNPSTYYFLFLSKMNICRNKTLFRSAIKCFCVIFYSKNLLFFYKF